MYEIGILAAGFAAGLFFCKFVLHRRIHSEVDRLQRDMDLMDMTGF